MRVIYKVVLGPKGTFAGFKFAGNDHVTDTILLLS